MLNIKDAQNIYDAAIDKLEAGDYPSGISGLYRAMELDNDYHIQLDLGAAYLDIGDIEESQKYYVRVLSEHPRSEEAYLGMINCFIEAGEQELANYYFIKGLKDKVLDREQLEEYFIEEQEEPKIKIYDRGDKSRMLSIASKLMMSGDLDYAEQLLKTIAVPEVNEFKESSSLLSMLYLNSGRPEDALKYSDKVLKIYPDDPFALICRILVAHTLGHKCEVDEYKQRLLQQKIEDEGIMKKAAFCMMTIGDAENARRYLSDYLKIEPYDCDILQDLIVTLGVCGNFEEAKTVAVKAHKLFPENIQIKYFASLIRQRKADELAKIMENGFDWLGWCMEIEEFMVKHTSMSKIEKALSRNESMRDKLIWLEQCRPCPYQVDIMSFFAQGESWRSRAQKWLLLPSLDLQAKKAILKNMLVFTRKKEFSLYTCGVLRRYRPKKLPHDSFGDAYYYAYATMAFVDSGFDKRLFEAYKAIRENCPEDKTDFSVIAAVMFYLAGGISAITTIKDCAQIFGVKEEQFMTFVHTSDLEKFYEFK